MASNPLQEKEIRIDFSSEKALKASISQYVYLGNTREDLPDQEKEVGLVQNIRNRRKKRIEIEATGAALAALCALTHTGIYNDPFVRNVTTYGLPFGVSARQLTVSFIREHHEQFAEKLVKSDIIRNLVKTHPMMHVEGSELVLRRATAAELRKVAIQEKAIKFYRKIPVVRKFAEYGPASAWRWRVDLRKIIERKQRA